MPVDLTPKSHVDTPAWQSFEMRMRARAAERRAAKRQRRIRRLKYAGGGVFALVLGVLSAFAWREMNGRAVLERALAPEPIVVEWPPAPESPPLSAAGISSLPLPVDWNAPVPTESVASEAEFVSDEEAEAAPADRPTAAAEKNADVQARITRGPSPAAPPPATAEPMATAGRSAVTNPSLEPAGNTVRQNESGGRRSPTVSQRVSESESAGEPSTTRLRDASAAPTGRIGLPIGPAEPVGRTDLPNPSAEPSVGTDRRNLIAEPPVGTLRRNLIAEPPVGTLRRNLSTEPPVGTFDQREPVRRVLERYRSAYQSLDASAARAVWPAVDAGALARAFGSLSAQELWFEGCSINVSGTTADATCTGQSRVVPKIGGGSETAKRTWQFRLRQAGTDWLIEKATVK